MHIYRNLYAVPVVFVTPIRIVLENAMFKRKLLGCGAVVASVLFMQPDSAFAYAAKDNLATPFDWQQEWGTIHINSYADGLNDPGIPSTSSGVVPCAAGANNCNLLSDNGVMGGSVVHGIKYDIKNSVVNCMSQQFPTCAKNNAGCLTPAPTSSPYQRGDFSTGVCSGYMQSKYGIQQSAPLGDPYSLVYMPLFDSRSNDLTPGGIPQMIINNCMRDIYALDEGRGAYNPVFHVFSQEERDNWVVSNKATGIKTGDQIPSSYYTYQSKSDNSWVYSLIEPKKDTYIDGTLKRISNYSNELAKIQAYKISDASDDDSFVIVDPDPFFDLRQYDYKGSPTPYAHCPVLGLKMYDGICDPLGKAGCNLPIYAVGPKTTFQGQSGSYATNNFPIRWSGYVQSWSFIAPEKYWGKVKDRKDINKVEIYRTPINNNPVLMLVRDQSYCTNEEMTSDPTSGKTDLPCVQYLQYVKEGDKFQEEFVDLYSPHEDSGVRNDVAAYIVKHDYNIQANRDLGERVLNSDGSPITFFDTDATYTDGADGTKPAIVNIPPVTEADGSNPRPGEKMGDGSGIKLDYGTSIIIELQEQTVRWNDQDVNCMEFTNAPGGKIGDVFIPTNTHPEYQSFVTAVNVGMGATAKADPSEAKGNLGGANVTGRPCEARFKLYSEDKNGSNPNASQTWYGTTSCDQIPAPSCNQVTTISAQRYCIRPTGYYADCKECAHAYDPDGILKPGSNGEVIDYKVGEGKYASSATCYFQSYCHAKDACPGLTSGGHVFCLAPDTKILMADGTEKEISDIKAGDEVMAFDAKKTRGNLRTAKVKATAITKKQKLVQIDDLKITPLHKIILSNGRAVQAKEIKVGDKILKASGLIEEVKVVKKNLKPLTVYNLSLDGADGYIAGGLRVLEYPLPPGVLK